MLLLLLLYWSTAAIKMPAPDRRFDEMLMNMAGQAGSLEALLGLFFSFLHRHTDFYVTYDPAKIAKAGMGFPAGKAEQLLLRAFRSFPHKPYNEPRGRAERPPQKSSASRTKTSPSATAAGDSTASTATAPSKGVQQATRRASKSSTPEAEPPTPETATSTVAVSCPPGEKGSSKPPTSTATAPSATVASATAPTPDGDGGSCVVAAPHSSSESATATTSARTESDLATTGERGGEGGGEGGGLRVRYTKDGKQIPIGNGGFTPRYYWTQTVGEATVYVDVPEGTRSRNVSCVIEPRRVKLAVAGYGAAEGLKGEGADVVIDGELPSAVSREESLWNLVDGRSVVISFEKATRSWWGSVVEGDPEIDTSQVRTYEEYQVFVVTAVSGIHTVVV